MNSCCKWFNCLLIQLVFAALIFLPVDSSCADEPVKIGILSFRPKPQTLAQWQPLAKALKHAMPERDFVIEPLTYPELNKAVAEKQLDFVFTNPGHFVQLKVKGGLSAPLATLAVDLGGRRFSVFGGSILSRAGDARINTLKDIRGRTIAVPDTESLGGYQMQAYELFLTGISLPKDAKLMITGMPHDNVVKAVIDGRADVGFVRSGVIEGMVREGKLDLKQLKILNLQNLPDFPYKVSTRLYPEWPFSALVDTDEKLARRVAAALFTLEESNASFLPDGIHSFSVPANYTPMEEMLRELRFPPFDAAPSFTVWDIWERYRWQILAALIALTAISLLGVRLMLTKRKLEAEKIIVSVQAQKLQESEEHLRTILDTEPECISIIDADGMIISMNPAGLSMIEADSQEQVIGRSVFDMIAPEYHAAYKDMHEKVIAGNKMKLEFEVLSLKEGRRMLETHAAPMYDRNRVVHIGVTRDISERKKLEKQLQQMAHYDMLTNLPNRTLFSDRFQQALTLAKRNDKLLAIMFIDLDRFKPVNDTYGHRVGDLLLQEVALRIKGCIRESDTVARVGGDEFIALLQNIRGAQEAKAVAEKIRDTLYQPYNISGHVLDISSSIGIAVFPENGKDETELSRNADMAMYDAKKKGRNAVQLFQETT